MSTEQDKTRGVVDEVAFESCDFYLACFLVCTGYDLMDLRADGGQKVFDSRDRPTRRDEVLGSYGNSIYVVTGFFSVLAEWSRAEKLPAVNDTGNRTRSENEEARHER